MEKLISMPMGIVVERRELNNRWQKLSWKPVGVLPGAAAIEASKLLLKGDGWQHFHMATLPLELHRKETLAYKTNLNSQPPKLYVVLRSATGAENSVGIKVFLVTASAFEAQDYLDSSDDIVEGIAMPDAVIAWVQAFCDRHHVDEPFKKRKRKRYDPDEIGFGRRPDRNPGRKNANGSAEPS